MRRYQAADESAARELIARVSPVLLRYFLAQPANRRFADDLLQDTWMRIHKARHTYRPGEPLMPWIFAIARHAGLDGYRRSRRLDTREIQVEELPDAPAPQPRAAARGPNVLGMLGQLPESQREVLLMLKVSGMTLEEVARATSSTVGSVKQKAHRAYTTLRKLLGAKES